MPAGSRARPGVARWPRAAVSGVKPQALAIFLSSRVGVYEPSGGGRGGLFRGASTFRVVSPSRGFQELADLFSGLLERVSRALSSRSGAAGISIRAVRAANEVHVNGPGVEVKIKHGVQTDAGQPGGGASDRYSRARPRFRARSNNRRPGRLRFCSGAGRLRGTRASAGSGSCRRRHAAGRRRASARTRPPTRPGSAFFGSVPRQYRSSRERQSGLASAVSPTYSAEILRTAPRFAQGLDGLVQGGGPGHSSSISRAQGQRPVQGSRISGS